MAKPWPEHKLGDLAEIIMGQSPPGSSYNAAGEGLPFIQGSAEFGFRYPRPVKWCTEVRKVALAGDLLISVRAPVGDMNFAEQTLAVGRGLAIVRGDGEATTDYLRLALEAKSAELNARSGAGMFESITKEGLAGLLVPQPARAEQGRIVDLMSAVECVATNIDGAGGIASGVAVVLRRSIFERHLDEEVISSLGEVATTRLGKMLSKAAKTGSDEYPYVRNADVQWDWINTTSLNTMHFGPRERNELALRRGDLLVCEGGEVGRAAVVEADLQDIYFQKAIHRVRCGPPVVPRYVMHYLRFCAETDRLADYSTQLTIQHLTGEKFRTLPVPVPPFEEQERSVALLDGLQEYERSLRLKADAVRSLRSALLGELLSGKHEVPVTYDALLEPV